MSPKAVPLPVTILNSEPGLHGIACLVAELSKFLEPTSSCCCCFFFLMCLYLQITQARRQVYFFAGVCDPTRRGTKGALEA